MSMQGKKPKRPVRTCVPKGERRKQSDAKWRASVASCYETLKLIIPNVANMSKRKASKVSEGRKLMLLKVVIPF